MEKRLVTQMTILAVAVLLVVALGTAFWRSSYQSGGEETTHQHNHHYLEFFQRTSACS